MNSLHRFVEADQMSAIQDSLSPLIFHGMILRSTLTALLKRGIGYDENAVVSDFVLRSKRLAVNEVFLRQIPNQPVVESKTLQEDYPRFPDIHDIDTTEVNLQHVMVCL